MSAWEIVVNDWEWYAAIVVLLVVCAIGAIGDGAA